MEGLQSDRLKEYINIVNIILDTIGYFVEKYPAQQIHFQWTDTFTAYSSGIKVLGNSTLLSTVLINVLDNAHKYSQLIDIIINFQSPFTTITISDRGISIPEKQVGDVFSSLMRAGNVGKLQGFGLGLTLAKKIIDLHEGKISIISSAGVGTTVKIQLPYVPLQATIGENTVSKCFKYSTL